mmetsp:Transcript_38392/g.120893  ORF Transcript_38392/g.120893 Transcript_38392/m.120893 type:complete len:90 (-) Transcript_38392:323-592(-)
MMYTNNRVNCNLGKKFRQNLHIHPLSTDWKSHSCRLLGILRQSNTFLFRYIPSACVIASSEIIKAWLQMDGIKRMFLVPLKSDSFNHAT